MSSLKPKRTEEVSPVCGYCLQGEYGGNRSIRGEEDDFICKLCKEVRRSWYVYTVFLNEPSGDGK